MNAVQLLSIESLPLVTPTHPARDDGIMDVARCAALHNFLALHGWIGLGNSLDDLIRESFFDRYGDEAGKSLLIPKMDVLYSKQLSFSHSLTHTFGT